MKHLKLVTLLLFSVLPVASAVASDGGSLDKIVNETSFKLSDGRGEVHVIMRETSHLQGLPYTVELRASCANQKPEKSWMNLSVSDSEAFCDIKPKSAKVSTDGKKLLVTIKKVDTESYNKSFEGGQIGTGTEFKPICETKVSEYSFALSDLCK